MDLMDKIVSLCKRRGFIFPSSEIYGGFSSCYDFGPLGVELKNNIKREWWKKMVWDRADIVGLDASILMAPQVWEASGHLSAGFADPLRECKSCHKRFRGDEIEKDKCPECGGLLTQEKQFNLMMKTFAGVTEDKATTTYLRAETCQGIYMNFENVLSSMRMKIPFGVAQIGKAFRNEITPGNFIFRTREFEQMEMQYFCAPRKNIAQNQHGIKTRNRHGRFPRSSVRGSREAGVQRNSVSSGRSPEEWFEYWQNERMKWYLGLGVKKENLKFREHKKNELAHYAKKAIDIEYKFSFFGKDWSELEGIHDRGQWDLSNHARHSGKDLSYFDEEIGKHYIPNIIETSAGADRSTLAFLIDAYHEETVRDEKRVVLKLHPKLAPVKVVVLPLVKNKPRLVKLARKVFDELRDKFPTMYDEVGSIGRRYRRMDEAGTPWMVTIDFDSLKCYDVTLRDRDTMRQTRHKIKDLPDLLKKKFTPH